jgi:hypothetical protein
MTDPIMALWNVGTLIIMMTCVIVTWMIKRIVETALPDLAKKADENHPSITYATPFARWWSRVIKPTMPIVIGGAVTFVPEDMLLPDLKTMGGRIMAGMVLGWFSTLAYFIVKRLIFKKTGIQLPGGSTLPPPGEAEPPIDSEDGEPPGAA